ncbi:MAG: response regulator [Balneolaceae bacterium]
MRVLVIEDNAILSLTLEVMLKKLGFTKIRKAYTADEALNAIDDFKPDLLLVDINLDSDLSGIDVVKIAQDKHRFSVLYTTANSDRYHRELAEHTPHEAYLIKPLSFRILSSAIEKVSLKMAV